MPSDFQSGCVAALENPFVEAKQPRSAAKTAGEAIKSRKQHSSPVCCSDWYGEILLTIRRMIGVQHHHKHINSHYDDRNRHNKEDCFEMSPPTATFAPHLAHVTFPTPHAGRLQVQHTAKGIAVLTARRCCRRTLVALRAGRHMGRSVGTHWIPALGTRIGAGRDLSSTFRAINQWYVASVSGTFRRRMMKLSGGGACSKASKSG